MKAFALLLILFAGVSNAQTIYRCGSSFSRHPCTVQQADATNARPMLRENETVQQFAERQARYLEERGRSGAAQPATARQRSGS